MAERELLEPPTRSRPAPAAAPVAGRPTMNLLDNPDAGIPTRTVGQRQNPLNSLRIEFDGYRSEMTQFTTMEPDEVLMNLSAYSARAGEVRVQLWRDGSHAATKMRTQEIDPFIDECDRQFKVHSRLQTIRELDWRMTGGAPA